MNINRRTNEATEAEVQAQVEAFFKAGGKVEKVPYGQSKDPYVLASQGKHKLTKDQKTLIVNPKKSVLTD